MIRILPVALGLVVLIVACGQPQRIDRTYLPRIIPPPAFAAPSAQACHPPSASDGSVGGFLEIHAKAHNAQLWALVFRPLPLTAGQDTKIVWRMTGTGGFQVSAKDENRTLILPDFGPERHSGSSWMRPGDEWGTDFTFPEAGCWRVHASRNGSAGDVYFLVSAAA